MDTHDPALQWTRNDSGDGKKIELRFATDGATAAKLVDKNVIIHVESVGSGRQIELSLPIYARLRTPNTGG